MTALFHVAGFWLLVGFLLGVAASVVLVAWLLYKMAKWANKAPALSEEAMRFLRKDDS